MGTQGWTALIWGLCCVSGALVFLRITADAISLAMYRIRMLDRRLAKSRLLRLEREAAAQAEAAKQAAEAAEAAA